MELNEIIKYCENVGSDHLDYFGGNFKGGYYLQQQPIEIGNFIYWLRDKNVDNYLEIGAAACGLTRLMCEMLPIQNVVVVDYGIHPAISVAKAENVNKIRKKATFEQFVGDSHSEECQQWLQGRQFDLIFIDGDHTYNGVKQDYYLAKTLLRNGGIIAFHDRVVVPDINKFLNELGTPTIEFRGGGKPKGISVYE